MKVNEALSKAIWLLDEAVWYAQPNETGQELGIQRVVIDQRGDRKLIRITVTEWNPPEVPDVDA